MPRDSNGVYSLPALGNPVVTLTTISSVWANSTLSDVATALTGSLARDGSGGMTGQLKLTNGTIGAPALSWATEPTSGLYRNAAGDFRYSIASNDILQLSAALVQTTTTLTRLNSNLYVSSAEVLRTYQETDAPADEKIYQWIQTAGDMTLRTRTDADGAGVSILDIVRAGTGITSKTWPTGINVFGDLIRSDTDVTDDLGTATIRFRRMYTADVRLDDNSIFIDQDGAGTLRVGGTAGDWSRVQSEYPMRLTFPSAGGVSSLQIMSTLPVIEANDTNAAADAKIWDHVYDSGVYSERLINDARSVTLTYRTVTRTATTSAIVNYGTGVTLQYLGLEVGFRGLNTANQNAGYTFVAADRGKAINAGTAGSFTINNSVFVAGDIFTFTNTTGSNCTLTQGAGVTFRLMGASGTTGNRTVADFGVATIIAQAANVFLIGGPGVS